MKQITGKQKTIYLIQYASIQLSQAFIVRVNEILLHSRSV